MAAVMAMGGCGMLGGETIRESDVERLLAEKYDEEFVVLDMYTSPNTSKAKRFEAYSVDYPDLVFSGSVNANKGIGGFGGLRDSYGLKRFAADVVENAMSSTELDGFLYVFPSTPFDSRVVGLTDNKLPSEAQIVGNGDNNIGLYIFYNGSEEPEKVFEELKRLVGCMPDKFHGTFKFNVADEATMKKIVEYATRHSRLNTDGFLEIEEEACVRVLSKSYQDKVLDAEFDYFEQKYKVALEKIG